MALRERSHVSSPTLYMPRQFISRRSSVQPAWAPIHRAALRKKSGTLYYKYFIN
jgi:hypothetical protein